MNSFHFVPSSGAEKSKDHLFLGFDGFASKPFYKLATSSLTLELLPPQRSSPHVTTDPSARIAAKARFVA
jgi:hypothetical protein